MGMKTALIVIDIQDSFRSRPSWDQISNPDIVGAANRLVDAARAGGHDVIWVLHSEPDTGGPFDPASGCVRLMEGLSPVSGEPTITKTSRNAFTTTNLDQLLTQRGIGHLVIAGIQTEQCCETTARLAADLGYEVTFVTEATATFPITRPDNGAVLSAEDVIARTEFALAGRFARISSIDAAFQGSVAEMTA